MNLRPEVCAYVSRLSASQNVDALAEWLTWARETTGLDTMDAAVLRAAITSQVTVTVNWPARSAVSESTASSLLEVTLIEWDNVPVGMVVVDNYFPSRASLRISRLDGVYVARDGRSEAFRETWPWNNGPQNMKVTVLATGIDVSDSLDEIIERGFQAVRAPQVGETCAATRVTSGTVVRRVSGTSDWLLDKLWLHVGNHAACMVWSDFVPVATSDNMLDWSTRFTHSLMVETVATDIDVSGTRQQRVVRVWNALLAGNKLPVDRVPVGTVIVDKAGWIRIRQTLELGRYVHSPEDAHTGIGAWPWSAWMWRGSVERVLAINVGSADPDIVKTAVREQSPDYTWPE